VCIIKNVYITQIKTMTHYMTDPSAHQEGHPIMYKTAIFITSVKSVHESPRGLKARTDMSEYIIIN